MAKRRKNRTHLKGAGGNAAAAAAAGLGSEGAPKTFIVKHGPVGSSVAQLVRDTRKIMEPNTASRLRVRAGFLFCHRWDTDKASMYVGTKEE